MYLLFLTLSRANIRIYEHTKSIQSNLPFSFLIVVESMVWCCSDHNDCAERVEWRKCHQTGLSHAWGSSFFPLSHHSSFCALPSLFFPLLSSFLIERDNGRPRDWVLHAPSSWQRGVGATPCILPSLFSTFPLLLLAPLPYSRASIQRINKQKMNRKKDGEGKKRGEWPTWGKE